MSEMIKRVGEAITIAVHDPATKDAALLLMRTSSTEYVATAVAEIIARAAIAAMRDPTEDMWLQGLGGLGEEGGNSIEVWQYMIDAALK